MAGLLRGRDTHVPAADLGRIVEMAGDELTGPQIAEVFARAAGRPVGFVSLPVGELRAHSEEMGAMFAWFNEVGFRAEVDDLRRAVAAPVTLESWVAEHWSVPVA
ncbi:hypothetical protein ACIQZN_17015 [Streptomyces sp. NPDC097595]|uniref:NmrA family NAD(P)-binding protein n=1 Tax=Streptomyces sp. NPDC097595 TaxID=3366090 RepID=UPI00381ED513